MSAEVSGERALAEIRALADRFGPRVAGTDSELLAAEHIAGRLRAFGVADVSVEAFPCLSWGYERAFLAAGGREVPCLPVAHTPATPEGGIEADLLYLERGSELDLARQPLEGRVGLLFGTFGDEPSLYRRLMGSGLAALLVVDDRLPFDWPVAVGVAPHWIRMGMIPMASVPYRSAWEMVRSGVRRVRLELRAWRKETESQNVVGVLPGSDPAAGEIVLTCHHDTVIHSVGGEDNGSGVGCVLELARAFAGSPPRRTLRFMACGAEEQLSEGTKQYVLRHRAEMDRVQFVLNTDSVGCWMGENEVFLTGEPALRRWVEDGLRAAGFSARISEDVSPYSDHFAFTATGAPAAWFHRRNCAGGRFFHHSTHDTPDVLSPGVLDATLRAQARLLADLAHAPTLPFARCIPAAQAEVIARRMGELYGVGDGFRG